MTKHYGIIGGGMMNPKVIASSLSDLPEDAQFTVAFSKADMDAVFDWLIDQDREFQIVGKRIPTGLAKYAVDTVVTDEDPQQAVVDIVAKSGDKEILVVWNDDLEETILYAASHGMRLVELTNGLTPIEVIEDEPVDVEVPAAPEVEEEDDEEDEASRKFSPDELENMPIAALKRQAKVLGHDITGKRSKAEIIEILMAGTGEAPTLSVQEEGVQEEAPLNKDAHNITEVQGFLPVSIVAVFASGASLNFTANDAQMKKIIEILHS
jgi:hypothetical protein